MQVTRRLADFIRQSSYEDFPPEAVEQAKICLLDFLGVALAALSEPMGKIIYRYLQYSGGHPRCSVIGMNFKTSPPLAALANGTLGHILDFDDTNPSMMAHPSVQMLPAALSLGEEGGFSGKKIIEGFVIGLEVSAKIGRGINPGHVSRGWFPVGTLGTLGSLITCAKILGLPAGELRTALGIAANLASGLRRNSGTMAKALAAGVAAQNGIIAARLAQEGCTADSNVIEGALGFAHNFSGESVDYDRMLQDLGDPWEIVRPGVSLKKYPCCARAHPSIEALLSLVKKHGLVPEMVEAIICRLSALNRYILVHPRPKSGQEAKFSLEYCMARALAEGKLDLSDFTDSKVSEPGINAVMEKIRVVYEEEPADKEGNWRKTAVSIQTRDGGTFTKENDGRKRGGTLSFQDSWVLEKFRRCASNALSPSRVEDCLTLVRQLDKLDHLGRLMETVGGC